jgi:hypothetical protein
MSNRTRAPRPIRHLEGRYGTLTLYEDQSGLKEVKVCQAPDPEDATLVYLTVRRYADTKLVQRHKHFDKIEKGLAEGQARRASKSS